MSNAQNGYTAVSIVPTGVGASSEGFAGNALPAIRLISTVADVVITHPNVLNGVLMHWPIRNALYVEGYSLDRFARGSCGLVPVPITSNKIGLLFDAGMDTNEIDRHVQVAETAKATLGLRVMEYTVTDSVLGMTRSQSESGACWERLSDPEALLRAAKVLVNARCDAIAIVAHFSHIENEEDAGCKAGKAPDGTTSADSVISHLVTREFGVPCAHFSGIPPVDSDDCPNAPTERPWSFLSCVLLGLARAPKIQSTELFTSEHLPPLITANNVNALIVSSNCFGGSATMSLASQPTTLVIAVEHNGTVVDLPKMAIGLPHERVHVVKSYAEAAGLLVAHKAGIDLDSIASNTSPIQFRETLQNEDTGPKIPIPPFLK